MNAKLFLLPVLLPVIASGILFSFNFKSRFSRNVFIECALAVNSIIIFALITLNYFHAGEILNMFKFSKDMAFTLKLDGLGSVFAGIIATLWPLTGLYAFEYMSHEHNEQRFFAWFVLTYGVVAGITLSGNLLTLYLFYELMTLVTLPLVMHEMDDKARAAGKKYLIYSFGGAACAFVAMTYALINGGGEIFTIGGSKTFNKLVTPDNIYLIAWFLGFIGFGVKAAIFPFHGWLPAASVAPTPVTALLHAVAVVKAGVFAVIRLTWFVYSPEFLNGTWAQILAFTLSCMTIFYGSYTALATQHLKRRFAYSTISQLSYILLGVLILTPEGLVGALTHMGAHAIIKINLFFCAGAILCQTKREYLFDMRGISHGMPKVTAAILISGVALCGLPPSAGFISKWQLGTAFANAPKIGYLGIFTILISAVLTVLYIFSVFSVFIMPGTNFDFKTANENVSDPTYEMLIPLFILAVGAFLYGLYSEWLIKFFNMIANGMI